MLYQGLEAFTIDLDWDSIEESLHQHILNSVLHGVSVLSVRIDAAPLMNQYVFTECEVDYTRDLDDEVSFTEALAALERMQEGAKK